MKLRKVDCGNTRVADLSPLNQMQLTDLAINDLNVSDLSPLRGMPLFDLRCQNTKVSDLAPLRDSELSYGITISGTDVSDLSPLRGKAIVHLVANNCKVADLSPLQGMPLETLECSQTPVTDLSGLKDLRMKRIKFTPKNITKGIDAIRQMKSIEALAVDWEYIPAEQFWKRYDAGEFGKPAAAGGVDKPAASPPKKPDPPKTQPDPHQLLSGHTREVNQLAITSDGKLLASASDDRTVRLWDLETGQQKWKTNWGNSRFKALAIEPSGNRIWAATDSAVCVIDRETGTTQEAFSLIGKEQNAIAFGKNCTLLATCFEGKVRIYNTAQKKEVRMLDGGGPALAFNHDATFITVGGWEGDGDIQSVRVNDGKAGGKFSGLKDRTMALQISPDDKYVAAASGCAKNKNSVPSNTIMVWEAATGRNVMSKPIPEGWCYGLAFSADGSLLAAGGCGKDSDWGGYSTPQNNKVLVWRIKDGKELHAFTGHTTVVQSLVFTPDGKNIISGSTDSTIRIWSLDSSRLSEDRDVAEWVLGKGGKVSVSTNGAESVEIQAKDQLPSSEFTLVTVDLFNIKGIVDQDLRRLSDLKSLSVLTVMGTSVTDSGLREIADLTTLTSLNVAGTTVNGGGFQHLAKLRKLEKLLCGGAPINDAALVHLKKLPSLKMLGLISTQVTDNGMSTIGSLKGLSVLRLDGTQITDKGLGPLSGLKSLDKLSLEGTNATKQGVAKIRAALPKCDVTAD